MHLKEGIGGEREGDFTDNFIDNKLKGLEFKFHIFSNWV